MIKLDSLKLNYKNPRTITKESFENLKNSIEKDPQFMILRPIIIDDDNIILGGNQRYKACQSLGMKEIPNEWIKIASNLTEEQRKRFILIDNSPDGICGTWDLDVLLSEWSFPELHELGFKNIFTDSKNAEIDKEPKIDIADELQKKWKTENGQLWIIGDHRLLCGDSTNSEDVKRCLCENKPSIMVTDPPYGVEYDPTWRKDCGLNKNNKKMGKVLNDNISDWTTAFKLFPGNIVYVYHAGVMSSTVQSSIESCGFKIRAQIIWAKDRMVLSRGDYHWQHEPCWYAVRDKWK